MLNVNMKLWEEKMSANSRIKPGKMAKFPLFFVFRMTLNLSVEVYLHAQFNGRTSYFPVHFAAWRKDDELVQETTYEY
jgi:hypothetical protein